MPNKGFFSLVKNCFCLIFLLFSQYFSVLERLTRVIDHSYWCHRWRIDAHFCQMPWFLFKLLHRLFQMSVGRSPISFWRRRKPGAQSDLLENVSCERVKGCEESRPERTLAR